MCVCVCVCVCDYALCVHHYFPTGSHCLEDGERNTISGYNLPSYEYLYHSGSNFLLQMRLMDHIMDNQIVNDVTLRIVLPEGAK